MSMMVMVWTVLVAVYFLALVGSYFDLFRRQQLPTPPRQPVIPTEPKPVPFWVELGAQILSLLVVMWSVSGPIDVHVKRDDNY